jgi:RNA polymerase sigma-70 factor (ECF subfamily)
VSPTPTRHGDDRAELAYRRLEPEVRRYFTSRRVPDADDLVGQVFLDVARGASRFEGDEVDLRRWVFTIARRRLVDDGRRRRRRPGLLVADPPEVHVADREPTLDVALAEALQDLTPLQQEVVVLRFVADLPLAVVARRVGRRVGAVKAAQRRALSRMGRTLSAVPSADPSAGRGRGAA